MNYAGMPWGMWALFAASFRKQLPAVFGYDRDTAKQITKQAKLRYKKSLPVCRSLKRKTALR